MNNDWRTTLDYILSENHSNSSLSKLGWQCNELITSIFFLLSYQFIFEKFDFYRKKSFVTR